MNFDHKTFTTKESLLHEGMRQLAENGYHGTGIKKILDVVNVPKGSFYNYFDSKEAYVAEIIDEYNRQALILFDSLTADLESPAIEKLELLYRHMLDKYAEANFQQGCLIGSLAAEIGHSLELCQKAMQCNVDNWLSRVKALIVQAQTEGSIRADMTEEDIAEVFWCTWEGALIRMQMDGNAASANKVLQVLFQQLLIPTDK
jgi:TetR/AcrR family transcriptional repressor of nem operon